MPLVLIIMLALVAPTTQEAGRDVELEAVRRATAVDFMNPATHLALSRYYLKKGEKLMAFDISEYARGMAGDKEFDQAFALLGPATRPVPSTRGADGGVSDQGAAELLGSLDLKKKDMQETRKRVAEEVAKRPQSAVLRLAWARILADEGKVAEAGKEFEAAAGLAPNALPVQLMAGRYLLKTTKQNEAALECYLNAYFLNPHCYDGEYAEFRIKQLLRERGESQVGTLLRSGQSLKTLLGHSDPTVVVFALRAVAKDWRTEYTDGLVDLMAHDDPFLRWQATGVLMQHVDSSFEPRVRKLLRDQDLRRRGLAAYIAVRLMKERSFVAIRALLKEEATLLRYDAVSALMMEGGEAGRRIVEEYVRQGDEKDPAMKKWLGNALQAPTAR